MFNIVLNTPLIQDAYIESIWQWWPDLLEWRNLILLKLHMGSEHFIKLKALTQV